MNVFLDTGNNPVSVTVRVEFVWPVMDYPNMRINSTGLTGPGLVATVTTADNGSSTDMFLDPIPGDFFQVFD